MNQTWQNAEKPNFLPHFGPFSPNMAPQKFLVGFISIRFQKLSQAITVCNFSEKEWSKRQQNGKKPHFRPKLGPLGRQIFLKIWLRQSLDIMVSYHHVNIRKNWSSKL